MIDRVDQAIRYIGDKRRITEQPMLIDIANKIWLTFYKIDETNK